MKIILAEFKLKWNGKCIKFIQLGDFSSRRLPNDPLFLFRSLESPKDDNFLRRGVLGADVPVAGFSLEGSAQRPNGVLRLLLHHPMVSGLFVFVISEIIKINKYTNLIS
jgi:hypothetical protein